MKASKPSLDITKCREIETGYDAFDALTPAGRLHICTGEAACLRTAATMDEVY
jgi:hypothetical protein